MNRNNVLVALYVVAMLGLSVWAVWRDFASHRHYRVPGEPSHGKPERMGRSGEAGARHCARDSGWLRTSAGE